MEALVDSHAIGVFLQQVRSRARPISECNVDAFLNNAPRILPTTLVAILNVSRPLEGIEAEMYVNDRRLRLNETDAAVIRLLTADTTLTLQAICERMPTVSLEAIQRSLLELARHDVLTLRMH